jgi:plastocyanin
LNSGLPQGGPLEFNVAIDAPAGSRLTFLCLIHTQMRLRVDVVAAGQESSPAALAQAKEEALRHDTEEAAALHARYSARKTKHRTASGQVVWDAWAGVDGGHVSLFGMYPKKLNIKRGQRVQWHFGGLIFEPHTVTFPLSKGLEIANAFPTPMCDPDGDEGSAPDTPPSAPPPAFCEGGPQQLELDAPQGLMLQAGDGRVRSKTDFESSGWRGTVSQPSSAAYTLRFPKTSGDAGHRYVCMIHPFMRGRVVVR